MTISFYVSTSDTRKAVKDKTLIHTVSNASVYRECSIMTPEFLVDYSGNVMKCNYCVTQIAVGSGTETACYFIRDKILLPGGRMVVICAKDVLSTYWEQLKTCKANLIRQEQKSNKSNYIFDDKMLGKASTHVTTIPFSENPFSLPTSSKYCVMLTVLGGSPNTQSVVDSKGGDDV